MTNERRPRLRREPEITTFPPLPPPITWEERQALLRQLTDEAHEVVQAREEGRGPRERALLRVSLGDLLAGYAYLVLSPGRGRRNRLEVLQRKYRVYQRRTVRIPARDSRRRRRLLRSLYELGLLDMSTLKARKP